MCIVMCGMWEVTKNLIILSFKTVQKPNHLFHYHNNSLHNTLS